MAKTSSKSAAAQKVSGGKSGQMRKFTPVGNQKPGVTAVTPKGGKKGK